MGPVGTSGKNGCSGFGKTDVGGGGGGSTAAGGGELAGNNGWCKILLMVLWSPIKS